MATGGELKLRFEGAMVIRGCFLGIVAVALAEIPWLGDRPMGLRHPWHYWLLAGGLALVALSLPPLLQWLRQPRGARLVWDEQGVTEWDGEGVRAAIRWTEARVDVRGWTKERPDDARYTQLQIRDGAGRRIVTGATLGAGAPCRRRARARPEELASLAAYASERASPGSGPIELGDLDPHRPGGGVLRFLGLLGASLGYPGLVLGTVGAFGEVGPPALVVGLIGLSLLLPRPIAELVSLARSRTALRGARPVELVSRGGALFAREADGEEHPLEVSDLRHPDAFLEEREGPAWIRDAAAPGGGAYRGEGRRTVTALETAGERAALRSRMVAVGLEILARAALAAVPVALLVVILG